MLTPAFCRAVEMTDLVVSFMTWLRRMYRRFVMVAGVVMDAIDKSVRRDSDRRGRRCYQVR